MVRSIIKGKILAFLFLKEKLFELYGIFTVAFIKHKNISTLLNVKTLFFMQEGSSTFSTLATGLRSRSRESESTESVVFPGVGVGVDENLPTPTPDKRLLPIL